MKTKTNWDMLEAALRGLRRSTPDGFTTFEFAEKLGIAPGTARREIGRLIRAGTLKFAGNRPIIRIDGRPAITPVYSQKK